jgi:hypothetical protein
VTSPRQAGFDKTVGALSKGLTVLGGLVAFWLLVGSVVWVFTWDGSGGEDNQPGISINTSIPAQPGVFGNTPSVQQQPPHPTVTINGQTYTVTAQK